MVKHRCAGLYWVFVCLSLLWVSTVWAEPVSVVDDLGRTVALEKPAQRIVSLAPHITENLFSAGAGAQIVGAVEYSDFPAAAKKIPTIGNAARFNLESIIALQPDLIVAWASGNGAAKIQQLTDLGFTVYLTEPKTLDDIGENIKRYGVLSGHPETAQSVSEQFALGLQQLRENYQQQAPVSVFYQVWNEPLYTVAGNHMLNHVLHLCGGNNVFASLPGNATQVSVEAVLAADPQAIIASGMDEARPEWLNDWQQWPSLQAVKNKHLFFVPPDYLQRHTARLLLGAEQVCQQLQSVRQ